MSLPPGTQVGRYTLTHYIGRGGMAQLYLAKLYGVGRFEREVVVKMVADEYCDAQDYRTMFLDEARLLASLNHPRQSPSMTVAFPVPA